MPDIARVVAWLCDGRTGVSAPDELLACLCDQLILTGIPLERAAIYVKILHLEIAGRSAIWRRGQSIQVSDKSYQLAQSEWLLENAALVQADEIKRIRLNSSTFSENSSPLLDWLRGEDLRQFR
jgi:adenylate cyclase